MPKAVAIVDYLNLRKNPECYKQFKIGSQLHKRYSPNAIEALEKALEKENADEIWAKRKRTKA